MNVDGAAPLPIGSTLGGGRYRIAEMRHRTGPVITYTADDEQLHRRVVIDELVPGGAVRRSRRLLIAPRDRDPADQLRHRFTDRARALARVGGGGIARVYAVLTENGTDYAVIQHVDGTTVADLHRDHPAGFTPPLIAEIAARTATALRAAHAVEVVHGGLDADHLVITESGRLIVTGFVLTAPDRVDDEILPMRDVRALGAILRRMGAPTGDLEAADAPEPVRLDELLDRLGIDRPTGEPHRSLLDLLITDRTVRPPADRSTDAATKESADSTEPAAAAHPDATIVVPGRPDAVGSGPAAGGPVPTWVDPPTGVPIPSAPTRPADLDRTRVDPSATWAEPPATSAGGAGIARSPADHPIGTGDGGVVPPDHARVSGADRGLRRRLTMPLAAAAIAAASAAPILVPVILIVVVLPVLATVGDAAERIERIGSGPGGGVNRRLGPWFVKNVVVSIVRAVPAIVLGTVLLLGHTAVSDLDPPPTVANGLLRIAGIATAGAVLAGSTRPSERFRSRRGLRVLQDMIEPSGRIGERLIVAWVLSLAVVAAAFWLEPTRFPW